jgi:IclR-like helix-turn-helix domain-containing protein
MGSWGFLSNHGRVLLLLAHDPGMRLRDIAGRLGITERSAYGIVTDLTAAGYISKSKDGRRNRYQIEAHRPLPEPTSRERTVGEVLALFAAPDPGPRAEWAAADPVPAKPGMCPGPGSPQAAWPV